MSFYILIAAGIAVSIFSFLFGFIIAGLFKVDVKISRKEEYEMKVKQFESLIEDLEEKLEESQKEPVEKASKKYHPLDMFPANLPRDYGLPRSLEEE
jgi:hypothetical protein